MKAKKKEIAEKSPEDYGVDISPRLTVVSVTEPAVRQAGEKVEDVATLVSKLKTAGAV